MSNGTINLPKTSSISDSLSITNLKPDPLLACHSKTLGLYRLSSGSPLLLILGDVVNVAPTLVHSLSGMIVALVSKSVLGTHPHSTSI